MPAEEVAAGSLDDETALAVIQNAFDLWFAPELDRRVADGRLPNGFAVWAVQAIIDPESHTHIYFNEQLQGVLCGRPRSPESPITVGAQARLGDLAEIVSLELTSDYPNAGHFTAILHNDRWFLHFDFRYNAGRIDAHVGLARQFLRAAKRASEDAAPNVAIENLLAAVELLARCFLLLHSGSETINATSHGFVQTRFNLWARTGAAPARFATLLNRLLDLRPRARYLRGTLSVQSDELEGMIALGDDMLHELETKRPRVRRTY
jgi:hypothetical protein